MEYHSLRLTWGDDDDNEYTPSVFPRRSKSMLGKGQIYLPKEGFKRALSWAEGVVSERVLETDNQNKKIEQLILNLLFHPQLKSYIRFSRSQDTFL